MMVGAIALSIIGKSTFPAYSPYQHSLVPGGGDQGRIYEFFKGGGGGGSGPEFFEGGGGLGSRSVGIFIYWQAKKKKKKPLKGGLNPLTPPPSGSATGDMGYASHPSRSRLLWLIVLCCSISTRQPTPFNINTLNILNLGAYRKNRESITVQIGMVFFCLFLFLCYLVKPCNTLMQDNITKGPLFPK